MPNEINQELDFEKRICGMPDRALLEFVARQNYETCIRCEQHDMRIKSLESGNKTVSTLSGGISGTVTAIIVSILNYVYGVNR